MKQIRRNATERYLIAMLDMHDQKNFNASSVIRNHRLTNHLTTGLIELGLAKQVKRGKWIWIAGKPTLNISKNLIQHMRSKRASLKTQVKNPTTLFYDPQPRKLDFSFDLTPKESQHMKTNQHPTLPQRYYAVLMEMYEAKRPFPCSTIIKKHHASAYIKQALEQLGYINIVGIGEAVWVASKPTQEDVVKIHQFSSKLAAAANNKFKRKPADKPQSASVPEEPSQKPATKPQEAVQQPITTPVVSTPTKRHSLLVHVLTLPLLAIIMAIQGLESYFRNLWKAIRR